MVARGGACVDRGACACCHFLVHAFVTTTVSLTAPWALEMGSPNGLLRRGWSRKTLQVGQEVKINGYRAKDGSDKASVKTVVFADGRALSGASSKGP